MIRNGHEVNTPDKTTAGIAETERNGKGPTDCWIVHDDQDVSVSREFV